MHIYVCAYMYICVCERERERVCVCVCKYIYIYIYITRFNLIFINIYTDNNNKTNLLCRIPKKTGAQCHLH